MEIKELYKALLSKQTWVRVDELMSSWGKSRKKKDTGKNKNKKKKVVPPKIEASPKEDKLPKTIAFILAACILLSGLLFFVSVFPLAVRIALLVLFVVFIFLPSGMVHILQNRE